jgi:hypothetical protein
MFRDAREIFDYFSDNIKNKNFDEILNQLNKRKKRVVEMYSSFFVYIFCLSRFPNPEQSNINNLKKLIEIIDKLDKRKEIYYYFVDIVWKTENSCLRTELKYFCDSYYIKFSYKLEKEYCSSEECYYYFYPSEKM